MTVIENSRKLVLQQLREKALLKRRVCDTIYDVFTELKAVLEAVHAEYAEAVGEFDPPVRLLYEDKGEFQARLTIAGDVLDFTMHSNVFSFEPTHAVMQSGYVREDGMRAYVGMIQLHNFLYDSLHYQRLNDMGYLIGRLFVNRDRHFFVEGKRQLGFLYNDFPNATVNDVWLRAIVESAMIYAIDFDLLVPPYDAVKTLSVKQRIQQQGNLAFHTGKRVGFKFQFEQGDDGSG